MKNDSNMSELYVVCIVTILAFSAQSALAASTRTKQLTKIIPMQTIAKHQSSDDSTSINQSFVQNSLYKRLMQNEHFLKWQDMARYFWEQQTGEQRLTNTSQKRFYKNTPRPIGKFNIDKAPKQ